MVIPKVLHFLKSYTNSKNMHWLLFWFFLGILEVQCQHKVSKTINSTVNYIDIFIEDADNLTVIPVNSKSTVKVIIETTNISFHRIEFKELKSLLKVELTTHEDAFMNNHQQTEKFCVIPPSYTNIIVEVPIHKTIAVSGKVLDVQSMSYQGNLQINLERGSIRLHKNLGKTKITVYSGVVYASVNAYKDALFLETTKGVISLNEEEQKSPYKQTGNPNRSLQVNSILGNIVLQSSSKK